MALRLPSVQRNGKFIRNREQKLNYDVARAAWVGDYMDPMTFLDMFVTKGGNNQTGWANPQYDTLIAGAKKNADPKARMQQLHDAEKILMTEMPVMPINYYFSKYTAKPYVKGVIHSPLGFVDFKTASCREIR